RLVPTDQTQPLDKIKDLIVEDNPDLLRLFSQILAQRQVCIFQASDGAAGVAPALREQVDVVLMDIQLPDIDGQQATEQLRSRGFKGAIVALTANAMKEERDRCIASGFDDYHSKPIAPQALLELVSFWGFKHPGTTWLPDP